MRRTRRKDISQMGLTHVRVTVRNPSDSERCWESNFLVDTGAVDSLVPRQRLEDIGVRPRGRRSYVLADGRRVEMEVGVAELELMGDLIGSTVLFGDEGAEPLLGVTALESLGIEIDPLSQQLRKRPSIRLKAVDMPAAGPRPAVEEPAPTGRKRPGPPVFERPDAGAVPTSEQSQSAASPPFGALPAMEGGTA